MIKGTERDIGRDRHRERKTERGQRKTDRLDLNIIDLRHTQRDGERKAKDRLDTGHFIDLRHREREH